MFSISIIKVAVIAGILLLSQVIFPKAQTPLPKGKDLLFFLQLTSDAHTAIYEVNYKKDGSTDAHAPVKGSWIRYEESGKIKELTKVEKKFAYGVKCRPLGSGRFEIRLAAYQKMPMYLLKSADQKYRIYIKEEGKNLLLKRVFIKVNDGSFWVPSVRYIDLFTTNSETGMEMMKRINLD